MGEVSIATSGTASAVAGTAGFSCISTSTSIGQGHMKNRFKLEAWMMILIPIIVLLVGFVAALVISYVERR
jgi:hypothetical protein